MVSFNCDGCGDVVKKPKLAQHYGRCRAPVTCLDCSMQFNHPSEAHSSCITEDEKYQKSFYKGKKSGGYQSAGAGGVAAAAQKNAKPAPPSAELNGAPNGNAQNATRVTDADKKRARDQGDETARPSKTSKSEKSEKKSRKERAKEATSQDAIKKVVKKLASRSPVPLAEVVERIAKNSGLKASRVESALLKQLQVTLASDGQLHVA